MTLVCAVHGESADSTKLCPAHMNTPGCCTTTVKERYLFVMTRVLTVSTGCVARAAIAEEAAPREASAQSSELPK